MKVKTSTGFVADIDDSILDDWEYLENLNKADKGDVDALLKVYLAALGDEQYEALKEHCRNEKTGRISSKRMQNEFLELLNGDEDSKKF